jgi:hypothetical protein
MKNKLWTGIVLAFGFFIIGCPNPEGPVSEDWTRITSFTDIVGTWEGAFTIPIPPIPVNEMEQSPASSVDCTLIMTITFEDFTEIINMDMDKYLTDVAGAVGKSMVWETIKDSFGGYETQEGMIIKFTGDYHMILTVNGDISQMEFTDENLEYAPYTNQDKTKIKMVLPEDMNIFGEGAIEIILYSKWGNIQSNALTNSFIPGKLL